MAFLMMCLYGSFTAKYNNHSRNKKSKCCVFLLQIRAQGRGELLVSLCWQPAANRLTVVVLKARNLPKMDVTGLAGKTENIYYSMAAYYLAYLYHIIW